jgi:hypothetical protein
MLTHGAGYPLYMPTPSIGLPLAHRKAGIKVGDVGVITANGAFDFLFNVCQSHDQQDEGVNGTFPGCSELLKSNILASRKFGLDTCLPSDHVRELQVNDHDS